MAEAAAAIGLLVFLFALVATIVWLAKKFGTEQSRRQTREQDAATMRRLAEIMSRRARTRDELTDWMRDQGDGERPSMPPRKRRGR